MPLRQKTPQQRTGADKRHPVSPGVVAALQEALLPPALPVLPRAQIAARYLAAGQEQAAGGDWFDAVPLADGTVALVVGDVVGHGIAASAAMGQLRSVLDELLTAEPDLHTVLARAEVFTAQRPALQAATMAMAVLDPLEGTLRYATCGHPPPLIIGTDGTSRYLPGTGTGPLGTGSTPILASATLQPGELVLLYSDGLIERPGRTVAGCMAELARVAADAASGVLASGAAPTPADRVCELTVELLARTGYADDVTTLAAQRLAEPVPPLYLELPVKVTSVTTARRAFGAWLDQVDAAAEDGGDLQLAIAEIVTNAIEHAYPPGHSGQIEFRAVLCDDGNLECQITDRGSWRVPDPAAIDRGHGLMVAGQVVDHLQVSHLPQASTPPGTGGTVVTLRHRLCRPAIIASGIGTPTAAHHSAPPFTVDIGADGASPRVRAAGPVDISTAGQFARRLLAASAGGTLPLTVDLTNVTNLASAGIRALYRVREQLAAHRQDLTLITVPGSSVALILKLAHLPYAGDTIRNPRRQLE
jgi:serine phosphatase RsbU (regulator of sigma subunit)/anti-sigma regulatory factor (Ser/Thr protein kinase)/anti-anti-sigma regulatory factor